MKVIAPNDVAVYGGLCALASFDRTELKSKVIDNNEFKQFLELEPHIRELIHGFYNSKYSAVLDIMEKWKVTLYCLDKVIRKHFSHSLLLIMFIIFFLSIERLSSRHTFTQPCTDAVR